MAVLALFIISSRDFVLLYDKIDFSFCIRFLDRKNKRNQKGLRNKRILTTVCCFVFCVRRRNNGLMMIWQKRAQDKSCDLQYMQIILNLKYNFAYHLRYLPLWKIMGGSVTLYWHFKDKSLPSVCNVKKLIVEFESANQVFCIRIVFFHRFLHIECNVQMVKYFKLQNHYENSFYYI